MLHPSMHFFFGLERKNGQKVQCPVSDSLRFDTGQVLTDHTAIQKHAVTFYRELVKCERREEQAAFHSIYTGLPQAEQQSSRVAALSSDELYAALQSMQSGKAPGIDGLPVYFNKCFWSVVGRDLLSFLSDSLTAELQEGGPDLTA